ncbi:3-dehydroquinate dehydratase [Spirochaetia bacterium]|nr:3-dehydroquinate dehydratase [Spirochaetia bacterium]GHV54396.1 3-dehydroquinate dehydratase [Spirochaetia bacterium]
MAKICLCLTGKTLKRDLEILETYRGYIDIAELRVDCLEPDERFLIRHFPERAGLPVILTIRRDIDGGTFVGGEGARIRLLSQGLAFADADRRRNFAYIDIEEDLNVPSLEDAARTFGTRIIRSYHNLKGVDDNIVERLRDLRRVGDELVKIAVTPQSSEDVLRVVRAAKATQGIDKILLCMGHLGVFTRILAEQMGSRISYTTAKESDMHPGAPGQLDPKELSELYRFRKITGCTKIFGVVGYPLKVTGSPLFFNTIFGIEDIDAVYVPFPADSIDAFMRLAAELRVSGVSVTVPYKEAILPYLTKESKLVEAIEACNTIVREPQGWSGTNTDAMGFSDSLLEFIKRENLKRKKVTIIGAGGAAHAVAAEVYRLGARALILNRTPQRARDLAAPYKFLWGTPDSQGVTRMKKFSDIIIQTTPAGMEGNPAQDPLELYSFSGKEAVMDLVYQPEVTPFLKRAAAAGCPVRNGYDMLIRQARYQYTLFLKKEFPPQLVSRVKF